MVKFLENKKVKIPLLICACIFYTTSFQLKDGFLHEAFLHLASISVELFIATFFIEPLMDSYKERESRKQWKGAKDVAVPDLRDLSNLLVSHMLSPIGFSADKYPLIASIEYKEVKKLIKSMITDFLNEDHTSLLNKLTTNNWNNLSLNIPIIKYELFENILIYKDVLPDELLTALLTVRRNFNKFNGLFSLVPEFFLLPEEKWPPMKGGLEYTKRYRNGLIKNFASDISSYVHSVNSFIDVLEKYSK